MYRKYTDSVPKKEFNRELSKNSMSKVGQKVGQRLGDSWAKLKRGQKKYKKYGKSTVRVRGNLKHRPLLKRESNRKMILCTTIH